MRLAAIKGTRSKRLELALLLAASFACVLGLMMGGVAPPGPDGAPAGYEADRVVLALVAGATLLAVLVVWYATVTAQRATRHAAEEAQRLRRDLDAADALLRAEKQALIFWDRGSAVRVAVHTLRGIPGVPTSEAELLRIGQWLEPEAAEALKGALDALFTTGRSFSIILRTAAGGLVEADGRAAGGRALLRFREVTSYRRELNLIAEQHRLLARDIRSGRILLDALPMPVWLKDRSGRITWVNTAYAKAVEAASEAEVVEKQIELLESHQRRAVDRALASGKSYHGRVSLLIGGERRAHDVVVLDLEDAIAAAAVDVAALETAQGELDRQVAAYDRTLDRVATAVALFNREQRLTFFNEAYLKLWQLDREWLRTSPTDGDVLDRLRELGRLPEVVNYRDWKSKVLGSYTSSGTREDLWHLPDGRVLHVLAELRPDGGVTYLFDDVTERLALEGRYNALIRVQRETLDSLKEGVAVFATDGRLKLFNSAFAQIWKLSPRALAESPHVDEILRHARTLYDDAGTWSHISRVVTSFTDEREAVEGQMVWPDQTVIDYAATPLPDGATLLTFADVTASKRYERALEERNEALVAADRLKNQFIGHVSYELRTPLTNIIGFSDLLASPQIGPLNDRQREYVGHITTSSKTLLAIIDDILDLATIDAGALELKLGPVDVGAVIDAAILGVRERAAALKLTFDIAIADDATTFIADEARVRQVLYNLLSNAVGFSPQAGTVRLTCWREGGRMIFTVEDHGPGIPEDELPRVFDRFVSQSHGSSHRGAGLGLPIVKSLVELHGGELELVSEPGRGTRVTVRFPEAGVERERASEGAARAKQDNRTAKGSAA